jgi:hypothetical protein
MPKLGRPVTVIELSKEERERLEEVVRRRRAGKADVQRARVVLLSAEGCTGKDIARRVGLTSTSASTPQSIAPIFTNWPRATSSGNAGTCS